MKVFKFYPPYRANGGTSFPETQKRSGVYLIKENDRLVYVGFSSNNLYRTLYRHFQEWTEKRYYGAKVPPHRVTYKSKMNRNRYTVRVVLCSAEQAERLEKMLIRKHKPRDNDLKYENYQVTAWDDRVIGQYQVSHVEIEAPF